LEVTRQRALNREERMGYGIVGEGGAEYLLWVPHHSSYGEDRTVTQAMNNLGNPDVSIHTALSVTDTVDAEGIVQHATGIMSYVEGGNPVNFGGDSGRWPTFVWSNTCTSYVAAFRVKINGGFVRAHHWVQFWGDPSSDDANDRTAGKRSGGKMSAKAVYGEDGFVRHIHTAVDLSGGESDLTDDEALSLAREMGHTGDYEVAVISPEDLTRRFISIDLESKRPRYDEQES